MADVRTCAQILVRDLGFVQMSTNCANVYIVFEFPSSHFVI